MSDANAEEGQMATLAPSSNEQVGKNVSEKVDSEGDAVASGSKNANVIGEMEIQTVPLTFVGLGKEDLLVLAGRPFWVRLRWTLFIIFWALWLGLLVGAALIIALSPGCEQETEPTTTGVPSHRR